MSQSTESRFLTKIRKLRAILKDESDCMYFIHTPIGIIHTETWNYTSPGLITIAGEDENHKYRFLVFLDEAMSSFPIEIKRKQTDGSKEAMGFRPSFLNESEDA